MAARIVYDGYDLNPDNDLYAIDPSAFLAEFKATLTAQEVRGRILSGENDFTIEGVRYTAPRWCEHPIRRLRVERARRWARRGAA